MINQPIGFFDSGIGGLTLLKCAITLLPKENYIYYSDNKNVPYGNKSKEEIYILVNNAFKYFKKKRAKAVVIACNTVTAECADQLRKNYPFKIIGVEPAVKPALKNGGNIAVLCTAATAASDKFKALIEGMDNIKVFPERELAKIIEKNIFNIKNIDLKDIVNRLKNFDNTVLGCTHYIFIKDQLIKNGIQNIYDGNLGTANYLLKYLTDNNIVNTNGGKIIFKGNGSQKNKKIIKRM